jgi:PAS domain S-box-containing protein
MFNSPKDIILDRLNLTKNLYKKFDQQQATEQALTQNLVKEALDEVYRRGDQAMLIFIGLHFFLAICFAFFHNTWGITWLVGLSAVGFFYSAIFFYPKTLLTRVVAGIILQVFVLLYIYQLNGLPEVRFFFFTSFTILIFYQDWRAMWPSVFIFFGQMAFFSYWGSYLDSIHLISHDYNNFITRLVPRTLDGKAVDQHGLWFYVGTSLLQVVFAGLWAHFLKRQTIAEALATRTLLTKQLEVEEINNRLEQTVQEKTQDLQAALVRSQANEEELRQNMEELHTTQEEMENQKRLLLENQENMQKVERELRQRQTEMQSQQWLESGLSRFDDIMRLNYDKNLEEFSDIIMRHLAELFNATQGAFYVFDESENALIMTGGYACTTQSVKKTRFTVGEGILGQIIKTKRMVLLEDLPEEGAVIESALTKVHSRCLLIMPMLYNEDIQGVIELASLENFEPLHIEFIQRLGKNVASMLQSIRGILRTQQLLIQSQEMTVKLRENAKELEKTKLEFEQQALDFQKQFDAIDRSMLVVEFSPEGEIIRANENFLQLAKYEDDELTGKHQSVFLAETYVNSKEYRQLWYHLRNNEFEEAEYECIAKDGSIFWIRANYYAIGEGKNRQITSLAYDITTEKEQDKKILEQLQALQENDQIMQQNLEIMRSLQAENESRSRELQDQLNAINISTAMVQYDAHGIIQYVNEKFLQIIGYQQDELIGQSHKILLKKKYADSNSYHKFWQKLASLEFVDGEFDFLNKNGTIVWLRGSYYPVSDQNGQLTRVMQLVTDITNEMLQEEKIKEYMFDLEVAKTKFKDSAFELQAQLHAVEYTTAMIELNPQGTIIRATPKFLELLKFEEVNLLNQPHKVLLSKDFSESNHYKSFWEKLMRNEIINGELGLISAEKKLIPVQMNYYPITDSGAKITKIVGIVIKKPEYKNGLAERMELINKNGGMRNGN